MWVPIGARADGLPTLVFPFFGGKGRDFAECMVAAPNTLFFGRSLDRSLALVSVWRWRGDRYAFLT